MYPKNTVLNTARSAKLHSSLSSFVVLGEVISVLFVVCSFYDVLVESCCSVKSAYTFDPGTAKMIPATIAHTNIIERIFFIPMYILIFLTIYFTSCMHFFFLNLSAFILSRQPPLKRILARDVNIWREWLFFCCSKNHHTFIVSKNSMSLSHWFSLYSAKSK